MEGYPVSQHLTQQSRMAAGMCERHGWYRHHKGYPGCDKCLEEKMADTFRVDGGTKASPLYEECLATISPQRGECAVHGFWNGATVCPRCTAEKALFMPVVDQEPSLPVDGCLRCGGRLIRLDHGFGCPNCRERRDAPAPFLGGPPPSRPLGLPMIEKPDVIARNVMAPRKLQEVPTKAEKLAMCATAELARRQALAGQAKVAQEMTYAELQALYRSTCEEAVRHSQGEGAAQREVWHLKAEVARLEGLLTAESKIAQGFADAATRYQLERDEARAKLPAAAPAREAFPARAMKFSR